MFKTVYSDMLQFEKLPQVIHSFVFFNYRHPGCKPISLPINSNLANLMAITFIFAGFTTSSTF